MIEGIDLTPSSKENTYVMHKGSIGRSRCPFTSPILHPKWPENLHNIGTLIYSIGQPDNNLEPAKKKVDRILRFNSNFESGNLASAYHIEKDSYRLDLQYDINKSGSCQWFYFEVKNTRKEVPYTFYISGFHKKRDVLNNGSKIFVYSQKNYNANGSSWTRAGYNYAYSVTNNRASLQFQIKFQ